MSTVIEKPTNGQSLIPKTVLNFGVSAAMDQVVMEEKLFELAQRKARMYSESSLVPKQYQNNIGNVLIAENMARRMGADTLMVMQNLYVVHGNPGWSAQFLIATFNSCGRFSAIKYKFSGTPNTDSWGCVAFTTELGTGEILEGACITIAMAKKEGWHGKSGSKWQSMPEQMMRYRAATFLIRTTAPEIGMGLSTKDELEDISNESEFIRPAKSVSRLDDLTDRLTQTESSNQEEPDATEQLKQPEGETVNTASPSDNAKAMLDEFTKGLPDKTEVNAVKEHCTEFRAAVAASNWSEDLKAATDDELCQLADERIKEIRSTRGK